MINLLERFFKLPLLDAVAVIEVARVCVQQSSDLVDYMDLAKHLGAQLQVTIPDFKPVSHDVLRPCVVDSSFAILDSTVVDRIAASLRGKF